MKKKLKNALPVAFAAGMMAIGLVSVWERPVAANKGAGTCCAPGNPWHCDPGENCDEVHECTILSGICAGG